MSVFLNRINAYCDKYQVPKSSQLKLLGHYPLFKAHWHAAHGCGPKKKLAKKIVKLFEDYELSHKAFTTNGETFDVNISFLPEDLSSFSEIFWGNEYRFPWSIDHCKSYVDLGANTGMAALYFHAQASLNTLILVEANPQLLSVIQRNLPKTSNITLESLCISGDSGKNVQFYLSNEHRHSSLEPSAHSTKIEVATLSLTALLKKHKLNQLDILKMDIEGAEYDLLHKDPDAFRKCAFIVAELHGSKETRTAFCKQLELMDFEIHREDKGIFPCENMFAKNRNAAA